MPRLLLGLLLCFPLAIFAQDPSLNTDTTFPGDKPAAKSNVPNAPAPASKPSSNVPDAPMPSAPAAAPANKPDTPSPDTAAPPDSTPLPRSEGESSSKVNPEDISPPPGDEKHPGADMPSDVEELHSWNPHQADKEVEVGQFYFKRDNFRAAEGRFEEALRWQWNHAEANYWLGLTEEKLNKPEEARKYYSAYLQALRDGPEAAKVKKALDRLGGPVAVAQNAPDGNGPANAAGNSSADDEKAHHGVKQKLKDLTPDCVHLGNGPCRGKPSTKDPS